MEVIILKSLKNIPYSLYKNVNMQVFDMDMLSAGQTNSLHSYFSCQSGGKLLP